MNNSTISELLNMVLSVCICICVCLCIISMNPYKYHDAHQFPMHSCTPFNTHATHYAQLLWSGTLPNENRFASVFGASQWMCGKAACPSCWGGSVTVEGGLTSQLVSLVSLVLTAYMHRHTHTQTQTYKTRNRKRLRKSHHSKEWKLSWFVSCVTIFKIGKPSGCFALFLCLCFFHKVYL